MKAKLLKVLHFLKLDALLLRVLERLSAGLTKKHQCLKRYMECSVSCQISATIEDTLSTIA